MIVDLILDRKDNESAFGKDLYSTSEFAKDVAEYESEFNIGNSISRAIRKGDEIETKQALCRYIDDMDYNPQIKDYINSKRWID